MRYIYLFFTLLFVLFAAVQYNDPDPWLWIPLYLYPAVTSFMAYRGKFNIPMLLIGMVVFLAGAIYMFPPSVSEWINAEQETKSLQMKVPFVEEARESLGLFIAFAALTFYYFRARSLEKQKNSTRQAA